MSYINNKREIVIAVLHRDYLFQFDIINSVFSKQITILQLPQTKLCLFSPFGAVSLNLLSFGKEHGFGAFLTQLSSQSNSLFPTWPMATSFPGSIFFRPTLWERGRVFGRTLTTNSLLTFSFNWMRKAYNSCFSYCIMVILREK